MIGRSAWPRGREIADFPLRVTSHHGVTIIGFTRAIFVKMLSLSLVEPDLSPATPRKTPLLPYRYIYVHIYIYIHIHVAHAPFSLIHVRVCTIRTHDDDAYIHVNHVRARLSNTRPDVTKVHRQPRIAEQSNSSFAFRHSRAAGERRRETARQLCFNSL